MAVKTPTKGTTLKHGSTVTPTDVLANVKSIKITGGEYGEIDVTTLDSATVEDWLRTPLRKPRGLRVVLEWDPDDTGHEAIRAAYAAGTAWYMTVTFANTGGSLFALLGKFLEFDIDDNTADGSLRATLVYKATAAETYTQ